MPATRCIPVLFPLTGADIDPLDFSPLTGHIGVTLPDLLPGENQTIVLRLFVPGGSISGSDFQITTTATATDDLCAPPDTVVLPKTIAVETSPELDVFKDPALNVILPGGQQQYGIRLKNSGTGPSTQTYVVDRIPENVVFLDATTLPDRKVYFSDNVVDLATGSDAAGSDQCR